MKNLRYYGEENGTKYEYPEMEYDTSFSDKKDENILTGNEAVYVTIPSDLLFDEYLTDKRISLYSFFMVRKGKDNIVGFTLERVIKWCGLKPDYHKGRTNDIIANAIRNLEKEEYLQFDGELKRANYIEAYIDADKVMNKSTTFAVVYLDEILKILNYRNPSEHDFTLSPSVVLLVFAYLRWRIPRRRKTLEANVTSEEYELKYPDAYNCYYIEIANDIHISDRSVSKAVKILVELGLIYSEALNRVCLSKNKWITEHTIFTNTYKREKDYKTGEIRLVDSGADYYLKEVNNKKIRLGKIKGKKGNKKNE